MLGLHCRTGFSLVAMSRGYSLVAVHRLLTAVASLVEQGSAALGPQEPGHVGTVVAAPGLSNTGSVDRVHGLSYSAACAIFLDQE